MPSRSPSPGCGSFLRRLRPPELGGVKSGSRAAPRLASPRGRSALPSFHALATPASCPAATGPCEGDSRAWAAAARTSCAAGSPAAERTGRGDLERHTGNGQMSGGAGGSGVRQPGRSLRAAEQTNSFYRVQVRRCHSSGTARASARSRTPSLSSSPPSFPPAQFPPWPRKLPPGPTALAPFPIPWPLPILTPRCREEGVLSLPPSASELAALPSQ